MGAVVAMRSKPTEAELGILRVLWERGPATVRDVHEAMVKAGKDTGYTTVLKLMQIMVEKGLVDRDVEQRAHIYRARIAEAEAQQQLTDDLLQRAFGGSARRLMMQLLKDPRNSTDIEELRRMISEYEEKRS